MVFSCQTYLLIRAANWLSGLVIGKRFSVPSIRWFALGPPFIAFFHKMKKQRIEQFPQFLKLETPIGAKARELLANSAPNSELAKKFPRLPIDEALLEIANNPPQTIPQRTHPEMERSTPFPREQQTEASNEYPTHENYGYKFGGREDEPEAETDRNDASVRHRHRPHPRKERSPKEKNQFGDEEVEETTLQDPYK